MNVTVGSIEVRFSAEEDFNIGALIALISPTSRKVSLMSSVDLEAKFSKEKIEQLKEQIQKRIEDGKFLEPIEIGE